MSATDTTDPPAGPPESELSMGIDPYERNWMRASIVLLVAFAATVTVAGFAMGFELPGADEEVDPRTVARDSPLGRARRPRGRPGRVRGLRDRPDLGVRAP